MLDASLQTMNRFPALFFFVLSCLHLVGGLGLLGGERRQTV